MAHFLDQFGRHILPEQRRQVPPGAEFEKRAEEEVHAKQRHQQAHAGCHGQRQASDHPGRQTDASEQPHEQQRQGNRPLRGKPRQYQKQGAAEDQQDTRFEHRSVERRLHQAVIEQPGKQIGVHLHPRESLTDRSGTLINQTRCAGTQEDDTPPQPVGRQPPGQYGGRRMVGKTTLGTPKRQQHRSLRVHRKLPGAARGMQFDRS